MKCRTLLLTCIIFLCACKKELTSSQIIGTPKIIGNLKVAEKDFPKLMDWNAAMAACASLDSGWRLPNKDELNLLYLNADSIGGFKYEDYWSSTKSDPLSAFHQYFFNGFQSGVPMSNLYNVRAVRTR